MNFTWVAADYCQNSQFQYEHAQQALRHYLFKGNETVLDVGCGDGKITAEIAKKVSLGSVLGIDSSSHMIHFAQTKFGTKQNNLNFDRCRAEEITHQNKFDLITSFACLHWVKNQMKFLEGSKNALKDRGKILITLYPKHPDIWNSIEETAENQMWKDFFVGYENQHVSYDINTYRYLCRQAGLCVDFLEETVPIAYFKTKSEMEDFLKSWLPYTDQIHPYLRRKFINSIGDNFIVKALKSSDGLIGMPFRRINAVLTKKK